jgi:tRNA-uridine 2-sulfurtransferase
MKKIVVGASGGVDSSVCLALLKENGYDPIAVSLVVPVYNLVTKRFVKPSSENINIVTEVCKKLNIKHYIYDVSKEFESSVVDYFIKEYKKQNTPNPCSFCNRYFKFKYLLDFAKSKNISFVATGHYAIIKNNQLLVAKDKTKDQTYGLCFLKKEWLSKIVFPLGNLTKKKVYLLAKKYKFDVFKDKKQSQDICFLKDVSVNDFLKQKIILQKGLIINKQNKQLGYHKGLCFYTIGQRKNLNLSKKHFVLSKKNNNLVVTDNEKDLYKNNFLVRNYNLLVDNFQDKKYLVKTRYSQKPIKANIEKNNYLEIGLCKPQKAITPGQVCTIYDKDVCVGGGFVV